MAIFPERNYLTQIYQDKDKITQTTIRLYNYKQITNKLHDGGKKLGFDIGKEKKKHKCTNEAKVYKIYIILYMFLIIFNKI